MSFQGLLKAKKIYILSNYLLLSLECILSTQQSGLFEAIPFECPYYMIGL